MKTVLFTQHMLGFGGIDRVACFLVNGFVQAGYTVHYVIACDGGPGSEALKPIIDDEVKLTFLSDEQTNRSADLARNLMGFVRAIRRAQPDSVVSTCNNMNWITALAVKISGVDTKLVLKTTNPIIRSADGRTLAAIRKYFYRRAFVFADAVLPLSHAEAVLLSQQFPDAALKFQPVINPYVTNDMIAKPAEQIRDSTSKIILGVGRFEPQKRLDLLIQSFALIKDKDARLVILGDGPQRDQCERLCRELGVEHRVDLLGFVDNVASWYHKADVFVLTSIYEGLPAVVFEALGANCPVITTDCFLAAKEILGQAKCCRVADTPSPGAIAAMIDDCLNEQRPNNLTRIAQAYSVENGIKSHVEAISKAMA